MSYPRPMNYSIGLTMSTSHARSRPLDPEWQRRLSKTKYQTDPIYLEGKMVYKYRPDEG